MSSSLTPNELKILEMVEFKDPYIAKRLSFSVSYIAHTIVTLKEKLSVTFRGELIVWRERQKYTHAHKELLIAAHQVVVNPNAINLEKLKRVLVNITNKDLSFVR